jgi:hypothetical protein
MSEVSPLSKHWRWRKVYTHKSRVARSLALENLGSIDNGLRPRSDAVSETSLVLNQLLSKPRYFL